MQQKLGLLTILLLFVIGCQNADDPPENNSNTEPTTSFPDNTATQATNVPFEQEQQTVSETAPPSLASDNSVESDERHLTKPADRPDLQIFTLSLSADAQGRLREAKIEGQRLGGAETFLTSLRDSLSQEIDPERDSAKTGAILKIDPTLNFGVVANAIRVSSQYVNARTPANASGFADQQSLLPIQPSESEFNTILLVVGDQAEDRCLIPVLQGFAPVKSTSSTGTATLAFKVRLRGGDSTTIEANGVQLGPMDLAADRLRRQLTTADSRQSEEPLEVHLDVAEDVPASTAVQIIRMCSAHWNSRQQRWSTPRKLLISPLFVDEVHEMQIDEEMEFEELTAPLSAVTKSNSLKPQIVADWKEAGAMILDTRQNARAMGANLFQGQIISMFKPPSGSLSDLPEPETPFGLSILFPVTDEFVEQLIDLENLECLILTNANSLSDSGIFQLSKIESLRVLLLGQLKSAGTVIGEFSSLPELHTLVLVAPGEVSGNGITILSGSPKLDNLSLSGLNEISDELVNALGNLPKLKSLTLDAQSIGDEQIRKIARLTHLQRLHLHGVGPSATERTFDLAGQLKPLASIVIRETQIAGNEISKLARLDQLMALNLINCEIGDEVFHRFSELKTMRVLRLSHSQTTEQGLLLLGKLDLLRHLSLPSEGVNDNVLKELTKLKQLESLQIPRDANVSKAAMHSLKISLPHCEIIHSRIPAP